MKWTDKDRELFNEFINDVLYEKLTIQDYHNIMRKLGASYNGSRFNTICHNIDGGKYNLAFNEDDKYLFYVVCTRAQNGLTVYNQDKIKQKVKK